MVASGLFLAVVDGLFENVLRSVVDSHEHYHPEMSLMVKEAKTYYSTQIEARTSPRENQVMKYKKEGYDEVEIAKKLHISVKSVYNAVYRYSKKVVGIDELK